MWNWGGTSHCCLWASFSFLQPSTDLVIQASAGMWHLVSWYWQEGIWPLATHSNMSITCLVPLVTNRA